VIQKLTTKRNFEVQVGGVSLSCNRVIAASISNVIARVFEQNSNETRFSLSNHISPSQLEILENLISKGKIVLNHRRTEDISQIDELFEVIPVQRILNDLKEEFQQIEREHNQLETLLIIQKEIDCMKEENLETVMNLISMEFQNETSLWHLILQRANRIHPKSTFLYENLIDILETMHNLPKPKLFKK
jgi:hypothetical protein